MGQLDQLWRFEIQKRFRGRMFRCRRRYQCRGEICDRRSFASRIGAGRNGFGPRTGFAENEKLGVGVANRDRIAIAVPGIPGVVVPVMTLLVRRVVMVVVSLIDQLKPHVVLIGSHPRREGHSGKPSKREIGQAAGHFVGGHSKSPKCFWLLIGGS